MKVSHFIAWLCGEEPDTEVLMYDEDRELCEYITLIPVDGKNAVIIDTTDALHSMNADIDKKEI